MIGLFHRLTTLSVICISFFIIPAEHNRIAKKIILSVREINQIKQPCRVGFSYDNKLIVVDPVSTYLVDPQNNRILSRIVTDRCPLTFLLDSKREQRLTADFKRTALCDKKGKLLWELANYDKQGKIVSDLGNNDMQISYVFTASNRLYMMNLQNKTLLSSTGLQFDLPKEVNWSPYATIAAHSTQEKIFYTSNSRAEGRILHEITIGGNSLKIDSQKIAESNNCFNNVHAHRHSPIRDIIAFYYPDIPGWKLYNPITRKFIRKKPLLGHLLAFHPRIRSLLAILGRDGFLSLYDIDQKTTIAKTDASLDNPEFIVSFNEQLIDFSPNGKQVAVIVSDRCFVINLDEDDAN
jgi:WD40 repeat protein